jgi:hypothetical protein
MAVLIVFQYGERVSPRSAICGEDGFTFRTYGQSKRAASSNELFARREDDPSARKDRAGGTPLRVPDTCGSTKGLRRQCPGATQND